MSGRGLVFAMGFVIMLLTVASCGRAGPITVSLQCYGEDEGINIENRSNRKIILKSITSSSFGFGGRPERVLDIPEVFDGDHLDMQIGTESDGYAIFDNNLNESARVEMSIDGRDVVLEPTCTQPATIGGAG